MLRRGGLDVKGIVKAAPVQEEPQPYIDCTGDLQVPFPLFLLILQSSLCLWYCVLSIPYPTYCTKI